MKEKFAESGDCDCIVSGAARPELVAAAGVYTTELLIITTLRTENIQRVLTWHSICTKMIYSKVPSVMNS